MDHLLQLQADLTRVPVVRAAVNETTALGAALLAGLAEGVWSSTEDISDAWRSDRRFVPSGDTRPADEAYQGWIRAVDRSRGWSSPG